MKVRNKLNWICTIALIILIELLASYSFYRVWTDPMRTRTYKKEATTSAVRPEVTKESVEKALVKDGCSPLSNDTIHAAGLPDDAEGFYDRTNNLVWYLLCPSDEGTAEAELTAVQTEFSKHGTVTTESDFRHETVLSFTGNNVSGMASRYHTLTLIGISRDGKHGDTIRQTMTETGFIYERKAG